MTTTEQPIEQEDNREGWTPTPGEWVMVTDGPYEWLVGEVIRQWPHGWEVNLGYDYCPVLPLRHLEPEGGAA